MQPPSLSSKSKARVLIDASDLLFKATVVRGNLAAPDAAIITSKILEVLNNIGFARQK